MGEVKGCVGVYSVEKFVTKRERECCRECERERERVACECEIACEIVRERERLHVREVFF